MTPVLTRGHKKEGIVLRPMYMQIQLKKMNVIPLAILGVKWLFSRGLGTKKNTATPLSLVAPSKA